MQFTYKVSILSHCSSHSQVFFSIDRLVKDSEVLYIRQQRVKAELDELTPVKEITTAIAQLKRGKAVGVDGIHPEILKDGGPALNRKLHDLLVFWWE